MNVFEATQLLLDTYEKKFNKELMEYPTITSYGITASEFFDKMRELYPYDSSKQRKEDVMVNGS